jgi:hypothetical protein
MFGKYPFASVPFCGSPRATDAPTVNYARAPQGDGYRPWRRDKQSRPAAVQRNRR